MRLAILLKRLRRKLREEGVYQVIQDSYWFAQRGFKLREYQATRVDFEERWKLLKDYVDEDDHSLLDIGCAEGKLTAQFANASLFSIGLDRNADVIQSARSRYGLDEGIGFVRCSIQPGDIRKLPEFDIVLLLTVYHHWYDEYGDEGAEKMLNELTKKADKILFELPDETLTEETTSDISEYYLSYLTSVLPVDTSVEFIGKTQYRGDERDDVLLAIYCSDNKQPA